MTLSNNLLFSSLSQLLTTHLALTGTLVIILVARYLRSPWRKVPPGPKGLPILGNAIELQNKGWMFESECKRKFGPSGPGQLCFFADSMTYHKTLRTYDVLECPWPAHYCLK